MCHAIKKLSSELNDENVLVVVNIRKLYIGKRQNNTGKNSIYGKVYFLKQFLCARTLL